MLAKVCGLTRQGDIHVCAELGVDFAGFIFHSGSSRFLAPEQVRRLQTETMTRVGVFVRHSWREVSEIMHYAGLHLAQLHGGQDREFCLRLGVDRVIKVLWPESYSNREEMLRDLEVFSPCCRYFLLDSGHCGGGHGRPVNTDMLPKVSEMGAFGCSWFLAGGLGPENIGKALKRNPDGVDLNSGVETEPGIKSRDLLTQTMEEIRGESI